MTSYELALLLHLVGAISFFAGIAIAGAAHTAALRRERPGEVAAVLGLARTGVLVVAAGAVLAVVTGLWLIEETGHSLGDGWLAVSLLLLVASAVLGAVGGRAPKRARVLAERDRDATVVDPQVSALLRDPVALVANLGALAAALAILVLMVWRP